MRKILVLIFGLVAVLAIIHCGKKSDDDAAATSAADTIANVSSLSITCGTGSCIGTEGK